MRIEDAIAALEHLQASSVLSARERLALRVLVRVASEAAREKRSEDDTQRLK